MRVLTAILIFNDQLEHLKLVLLEGPHVLHLLLMNALCLLEHAAMATLRLGLLNLDHALTLLTIALSGLIYLEWRESVLLNGHRFIVTMRGLA